MKSHPDYVNPLGGWGDRPTLVHCDPQGLIQPVKECPTWWARNMDKPLDEPVKYVASDYQEARRIALSHFNGSVVAVWRDGE